MNNEPHITEEDLNEYLDGLIEPQEQPTLKRHLEHCTECSTRLAGLRFAFQAMDELPEATLGRDLRPDILEALVMLNISASASPSPAKINRGFSSTTWLVIVFQLIAAFTLFFFAIPEILKHLSLAVTKLYFRQAQWAIVILIQESLKEWQRMWLSANKSLVGINQVLNGRIRLSDIRQIPTLEIIAFLAAISLLWFVVNCWLLWKRRLGNHTAIWL